MNVDPGGLAITDASGKLEAWVSDFSSPRVLRVDLSTGQATSVDSGVPLSRLLASPAVDVSGVTEKLPAGAYVYGIGAERARRSWPSTSPPAPSPPRSPTTARSAHALAPHAGVDGGGGRGGGVAPVIPSGRPPPETVWTCRSCCWCPSSTEASPTSTASGCVALDVAGRAQPATAVAANPSLSALDSNGNQNGAVNYTIPVIVSRPNPAFEPGPLPDQGAPADREARPPG